MSIFSKDTEVCKWVLLDLLISALVVSVLVFSSCGRLPPEKFWTGDSQDSTSIKNLIVYYDTSASWRGFLSHYDFEGTIDTIRYSVTRVFPNSEVASLEFKIKQAYGPARLNIALTEKKTDTNIVFVYDTTATVELITKFKGVARIGCDSVRRYLKDTIIGNDTLMLFGAWTKRQFLRDSVIRGETVWVYDSLVQGPDSIVLVKEFDGQVWRSLHFEPEDKKGSPRIWKLSRISGGASARIPDNEDDAPYNYRVIVKEKNKVKADTILNRPDTIHYGIHRLYKFPDSVYSYGATQDSLEISQIYPILNPQDTALYFAHCDKFYSLTSFGAGARVKLTAGGYPENINFLSFIICPRQSLIYKKSPFKLRVWQIPVKVQ